MRVRPISRRKPGIDNDAIVEVSVDGGAAAGQEFGRAELVTEGEVVIPLLHPVIAQPVVGDDLLRCRAGECEQHQGQQPAPRARPREPPRDPREYRIEPRPSRRKV